MAPSVPSIIECASKTTLDRELDGLRPQLCLVETEESWDAIYKAFFRLTALCKGGGCDYPRELIAFLRDHVRSIINSLNSERSRLSGCAADMVGVVASGLGHLFEPLLHLLFPALLTLCTRPNKLFVNRARSCLLLIIEHTQLPAILTYLVGSLKEKSVSLRLASVECILACLNHFNPRDLEKDARAREVELAIKSTATDPSADVRKASRKVFETYKVLFGHRVDSFVSPMTPTMRKYLDIKASHAPHSRPPSRPDSAQSCHSQGAEVQSTKRTLQSKPQDIAKAPVDLAHFRSASAPQAVPERHRQTLRSGDTTQPSSDRAQSSRHPNHSRPASSNDRRRADMPPPEHIPSRPAQRPVSSLSTRSHDAALHSTAESSQAPFKHVQGNSTGPVPTGLVRRPALPGTQVLSTMSAPLRPPLHQRAATTESGRDGPLRPLTGNEPEVKSESTDLARSTKGPKRVPVSHLETSKPEGREEKRPLKSAFRELTSVNTTSAMSADGSATNPLPKATTLKRTKSKAALPSQPPATKTRAAALSKSETGTTTTREVRSEVKGTKDAPLRSTSRMDNAPSSQRGNEARAKETKKEAAKPVWGQRAASKSGPAKASGAKQSSMNKKENVGAGARPGSKKQTPEPEKIPLPSSPLASPTPSLVPLPPSPDVAEAILPPEDSTAPAEPREAAEELESMNDNAEASEELHDEAAPLALDPATATQPITTAKNQALRSRVAFLQDELPTPARTPISKLVSAIERGFIFTPGSPQAGLEPYDLSLDSSIDIMTPIPALAIPAKDAGDQSF